MLMSQFYEHVFNDGILPRRCFGMHECFSMQRRIDNLRNHHTHTMTISQNSVQKTPTGMEGKSSGKLQHLLYELMNVVFVEGIHCGLSQLQCKHSEERIQERLAIQPICSHGGSQRTYTLHSARRESATLATQSTGPAAGDFLRFFSRDSNFDTGLSRVRFEFR